MSEFEMAYLANELHENQTLLGTGVFTTVTAFLVASYLVAHRLTRFMVATVIGVYTIWFGGAVFQLIGTTMNRLGLAREMQEIVAQGKGLEWHVCCGAPQPQWAGPFAFWFQVALYAIIYLASLAFFLHCRRLNRKADAELATAGTG